MPTKQSFDLERDYVIAGKPVLQARSFTELYHGVPRKYGTGMKYDLIPNNEITAGMLGDLGTIKALFPAYHERLGQDKASGKYGYTAKSADQMLQESTDFVSCWWDAWWTARSPAARVKIVAPAGVYFVNHTMIRPMGIGEGAGAGDNYGNGGTMLVVQNKNWIGDSARRDIFRSWNIDRGADGKWNGHDWDHYDTMRGFRLRGDGGDWLTDDYRSSGIMIAGAGEASLFEGIYAEHFNGPGYTMVGGTPVTMIACSAFLNNECGFRLADVNGLATYRFITPSGDMQPSLFKIDGWNGGTAGGSIMIAGAKCEFYSDQMGKDRFDKPGKHQLLAEMSGYARVHFDTPWVAGHGVVQDSAIRVDGNTNNDLHVTVTNGSTAGVVHWLHDVKNNWKLKIDDGQWDTGMRDFEYSSLNGGTVVCPMFEKINGRSIDTAKVTGVAKNRLNGLDGDTNSNQPANGATWNQSAGLPNYDRAYGPSGTTPPPNPVACTGWTTGAWSAWSTCVNGQQTRTRTVTATPAGCTGTPPNKPAESETQACTVTPPPTGAKFTGGPYNVTSATFNVPLNPAIAGVTRAVLTGFKPTALTWGRIFGVGGTQGGLMLDNNGDWWWNSLKIAGAPRAPLNVTGNYTINLPTAGNITTLFQTSPGQGGAQQCTLTKLELF